MASTALAAAPAMIAVVLVALFVSPHEFAESDTATGWGLWLGAILGLVVAMVVYALPQLPVRTGAPLGDAGEAEGNGDRSGVLGLARLQPLVASLVGGWSGVAPVAVVMVAAAGVLDGCVCVVAFRGLRRLGVQSPIRAVIPRT